MEAIKITNPANQETLGEVPNESEAEVRLAVNRARVASSAWRSLSFKERALTILSAQNYILENLDSIATLISKENGKPLIEAISHDVMPVMDLMQFFAKKTESLIRKEKIKLGKWALMGHSSHIEYDPFGVIGIISPWNFPFSIPLGGVVMALMAGNTVVLKPSEHTPLVGLKIGQIFQAVGLPKNVFSVVTGDGLTGSALVRSGVDKIVFTGSVATGKRIMVEAAQSLTPVTLELGGKDPLIVLKDADLEMASSAAVWGAFCNSGQVCASIERVYVPESLKDEFTKLVVEKTKLLRQGDGLSSDVDIGAMTMNLQVEKVEAQVQEAKSRGAKILIGGERNTELGGNYYRPTVILEPDSDLAVVQEETFGPILPIMTYRTEEEAISLANTSKYALNAYIWTGDLEHGKRLASQIEAGTVNVNESVFTYALPQTPWGGPKESGMGRTHGVMGLMEMVKMRHVHVNRRASKKNNFWWYGYSAEKLEMMRALCWGLFGKGWKRVQAFYRFIRLMGKVKTM